jgi:hypothetical protein
LIIYVEVPPQTIYVQVPASGSVSDTAAARVPAPTTTTARVATPVPTPTRQPAPTQPPRLVSAAAPPPPPVQSSFGGGSRATATPNLTRGTVVVNFAGAPSQRPTASVAFAVQPGQNAWTAVREALGAGNLTFSDFGGSLGVFITGFYGVQAQGNHFWEFFVNGQSSSVGVSGYIVKNGDVLEFRYSSF